MRARRADPAARASAASASEPVDELGPALRRELEPGRAGVAAVADEQVAHASSVAPRSSEPSLRHDARIDVAELGPDDRRPAAVLGEACRDEPDDADGPRAVDAAVGRRIGGRPRATPRASATAVLMRSRRVELAVSRASAAGPRSAGSSARSRRAASSGLPHPPGGVEPRGDGERDRLEVHRGRREPGRSSSAAMPGARRRAACARARAGRSRGSRRRSARRRRPCRSSPGRPVPAPPRGRPAPPRGAGRPA